MIAHIIFYIFAALAVCSAIAVITVRNPVRSVLSLVVTFFAMSGCWMLLQAEFLSLILLLVYVGAVMTLFLFVVMLLNIDKAAKHDGFVHYLPFAMLIVVLIVALVLLAYWPTYLGVVPMTVANNSSNIQQLGAVLYTDYAYPFEIAGVILLAAMIAAITLTHRGALRRKTQQPNEQMAAQSKDRVRLIKGMNNDFTE